MGYTNDLWHMSSHMSVRMSAHMPTPRSSTADGCLAWRSMAWASVSRLAGMEMCVSMCVDVCVDMCVDMCVTMHVDMRGHEC